MSTSSPSPFDLVCENLRKLGAIPVDQYLASLESFSNTTTPSFQEKQIPIDQDRDVEDLEQAVRSTFNEFSLSDALQYRIEKQSGDDTNIKCILIITRPHGASRIFESQACHTRDADAKAQAAKYAVSNGGLDFILYGDSVMRESSNEPEKDSSIITNREKQSDPRISQIEDLYQKQCPGPRPPEWIVYEFPVAGGSPLWGAALRIHLAEPRLYSTDAIYPSVPEALAACAQAALDERVLEAIMCEKGSPDVTQPKSNSKLMSPSTLQHWYGGLPQPLPEAFGAKPVNEINAPVMLNRWITKARGARLKMATFWPRDATFGLFGCILRIERPSEYRNYCVEPLFVKRSDAKHAVCILAIIQGVEGYIDAVIDEIHNRISPQLKTTMQNQFIPSLAQTAHNWTFKEDRDAFGCTLTVSIGAEEHRYVAEPEHRTKAGAKVAAAAVAAERGLPELLRFRGQPSPLGLQTYWEGVKLQCDAMADPKRMHERETDAESGRRTKKRKRKAKELEEGEIASSPSQKNTATVVNSQGLPPFGPGRTPIPQNNGSASSTILRRPPVAKASTGLSGGVSLGVPRQPQPLPAHKPWAPPSRPFASSQHIPAPQFSTYMHPIDPQNFPFDGGNQASTQARSSFAQGPAPGFLPQDRYHPMRGPPA